jgi:hypothetical protein
MDPTEIKARVGKPMTNDDLERNIGVKPEDIIKYSSLSDYKDIQELLPAAECFKIILIEDKYNSGHWVCIMRRGKTIEYFNSYGAKWDTDWKFINRMMRIILGQETNEMTRLMDKATADGFTVCWNRNRFQKLGGNVQTCGRWVTMRIETFKMGYNLEEFKELMEKLKKEVGGRSADFAVAAYVK